MRKYILLLVLVLVGKISYSRSTIDTIRDGIIKIEIDSNVKEVFIGTTMGVDYRSVVNTDTHFTLSLTKENFIEHRTYNGIYYKLFSGYKVVILCDDKGNTIRSYSIYIL